MSPEVPKETVCFDFDAIFKLRLEAGRFPHLEGKFDCWKSETSRQDLTISLGEVTPDALPIDDERKVCAECYQVMKDGATYEVGKDSIVCQGAVGETFLEHNLLMSVMNQRIVGRGYYLAYAAAASYQGKTIILPGFSGSGKTSILLELLSRGADYLGNNNVFVDRKGNITLYSPQVSFLERNARIFPELVPLLFSSDKDRRRQEKRLSFHQMGMSVKGKDPFSQSIRRNLISRFYFFCYVGFNQLFPGCKQLRSQKVTHAIFLERRKKRPVIFEADPEWLANLAMIHDWVVKVSHHSVLAKMVGLPFAGQDDIKGVLDDFFHCAECYEACVPSNSSREDIKKLVDEIETLIE